MIYVGSIGGVFGFLLGALMFGSMSIGAVWAVVKAFRFHVIRLKIQRLVKERNRRFDCSDKSYKDIQKEIDHLTCKLDQSEKRILNTYLAKGKG